LLDYYSVIIHLFLGETRDFYSLERLWADAPAVDMSDIITEN
ncbi:MAG: RsfS/YbeB/iojap family protein, partial [Oscillospiraceae bacterium]